MNTKQLLENMEEVFEQDLRIDPMTGEGYCANCQSELDEYGKCLCIEKKDVVKSHTRSILEAFAEEVIGEDDPNMVDGKVPDSNTYRNVLRDEQRQKAKEIISSIEKA